MRIYIPSMSRHGDEHLRTVQRMPPAWQTDTVYVVPEEQYTSYASWLLSQPNGATYGPQVVACPAKGIAATRHWIGQYAAERGEDKFAMMDDDLGELYVRTGPDDWHLRKQTPNEFADMMAVVEYLLSSGYAHVGISPREGNNRHPPGPAPLIHENTRTLRFLCYRTKEFLEVEHGRVAVMEDFDVNLQLLERGHANANLMYWAQNQRGTAAPGGCSDYRTLEVQDESARNLAELHPGLVRTRLKQNKTTQGGFGTRTEVTIYWKKAYEQGLRAKTAAQTE